MARIDSVCLPSNQKNRTGVYPAAPQYEKDIWKPAADHFKAEMEAQGHTCKIIYIEPAGDASTDELLLMVKAADKYLASVTGYKLATSLHSNTGAGTLYMMPLVYDYHHDAFARTSAHDAARRTGMIERAPYHKSIYFTSILNHYGPGHVLLWETGEHQSAIDAGWLGKYAPFCVRMEARSLILACGQALKADGPVPGNVVVPAGAIFDRYRPTVLEPPPTPPPVTFPLPLKVTSPMMHDPTAPIPAPATWKITEFPIHWAQNVLKIHTYKTGPVFTYRDLQGVSHEMNVADYEVDGWWGPKSSGLLLHFQKDPHYGIDGKILEPDGILDQHDLDKLRTV